MDTERKSCHEHHNYEHHEEDSLEIVVHKTIDSHITLWGLTDDGNARSAASTKRSTHDSNPNA